MREYCICKNDYHTLCKETVYAIGSIDVILAGVGIKLVEVNDTMFSVARNRTWLFSEIGSLTENFLPNYLEREVLLITIFKDGTTSFYEL